MENYIIVDRDWVEKEISTLKSLLRTENISDKGNGALNTFTTIIASSVDAMPVFEKCFDTGVGAGFAAHIVGKDMSATDTTKAEFINNLNPFID